MRSELKAPPSKRIPVFLDGAPPEMAEWARLVENRARCEVHLEANPSADSDRMAVSASGGIRISIPLEGLVDFDKERTRVTAEIASLHKEREGLEAKLSNEQFLTRAPEAIVMEKKQQLAAVQARLADAQAALRRLA